MSVTNIYVDCPDCPVPVSGYDHGYEPLPGRVPCRDCDGRTRLCIRRGLCDWDEWDCPRCNAAGFEDCATCEGEGVLLKLECDECGDWVGESCRCAKEVAA